MMAKSQSIRSINTQNTSSTLLSSRLTKERMKPCLWKCFIILMGISILHSSHNMLLAAESSSELDSKSQSNPSDLAQIQTILVTGTVKSWLEGGKPNYSVVVTLKLKLQDAGFTVVFDPALPHDANLHIAYEEYASGQFQVLEQATALTYSLQLVHSQYGKIFSRDFAANPNPTPVGSLYWDTISNLEENPRYYFLGDILWEHLQHGMNEETAMLKILMAPYTNANGATQSHSRSMNEAIVLKRARINAIKELGQGSFNTPQARTTLWKIAKNAKTNERHEAVTQLGKIGDRSILADLTELMENEADPDVQSAAQYAISLIESR